MNWLKFLTAIILVAIVSLYVYGINRKLVAIEEELSRYRNGVTSINVPNLMKGDVDKYLVIGLSKTYTGGYVPMLIGEGEYENFYNELRRQILEYKRVSEERD